MKRFLLPLLTLCLWAPNLAAQEKEKPREPFIHKMANGLQIQAFDRSAMRNDVTDMLDIQMWKIRVSTRHEGKRVMMNLELRTPGKPTQSFGSIGGPLNADFIFGLQPIGGDYIASSPKIRLYERPSFYTKGVEDRYPGNSRTLANPFLDLGSWSSLYNVPVRTDGSVVLVTFQPSGKDDDPKNSELVVVATLQDPPLPTK